MPGVVNSDCRLLSSREVGKMAFFMHPDFIYYNQDGDTDQEDSANGFQNSLSLAASPKSTGDNGESEGELLPDELRVDLEQFCDNHDFEEGLPRSMRCEADCNNCKKAKQNCRVSSKGDPFMGLNRSFTENSTHSWSVNLLEEHQSQQQQSSQPEAFNAWSHTSNKDEYHLFTKSSFSDLVCPEDDNDDAALPPTPSTYTDNTVAGDDSDVDIETVAESPSSIDVYSSSQDSSALSSPALSPASVQSLQRGSLMTILHRSSDSERLIKATASLVHKPLIRQGVSSSASLAENLISGHSTFIGQKRKLQKEKKMAAKSTEHSHSHAYSHVLVNSNSVNFHDYAMIPGSCFPSTETGRPTVISKRLNRKRQYINIDASDKEKQHHHNQLERNRRQKLADLFTDLRDEVPKIKNQTKASKVVVLNEATVYIRELNRLVVLQEEEASGLLQRQIFLQKQLRLLECSSR